MPRRWSGGWGRKGLSAVRVFGDDVAEVIVKEGPESLSVLRKAGRGGWSFFTNQVLPNKKKLAAAGVLAVFLANPEKFVDYAGQATEFAVREFAKAGIQLASAAGLGAARGLETSIGHTLASYGLNYPGLPLGRHGPGRNGRGRRRSWSCSACRSAGCCGRSLFFRPIGFIFHRLTIHRNRDVVSTPTPSDRDRSSFHKLQRGAAES